MANLLPRWRGFNLLEMYGYEAGQENVAAGSEGDFREADLALIREWGFDFIRIPMDYRNYTMRDPEHATWRFHEPALARVDRIVKLGREHGLHVSLNFHRTPGYCVNAPAEPRNLWTEPAMQTMFCTHWHAFALRYRDVPARELSFDLVNEPPAPGHGGFTRKNHEQVIRAAVGAIRSVDPARLIIADGVSYGHEPVREIVDLGAQGVGQSCRAYHPFGISHYKAEWNAYQHAKLPQWPGSEHFGSTFEREDLEAYYAPWAKLIAQGVGVHCGEGGCYRYTPHAVFLAWFADVLTILRRHEIGWALWNFRGHFGVLDTQRTDTPFEEFRGHKLDRQLLELLRAN